MFDWCYKLTSLDLSSFNTSNVVSMSYMFKRLNGSISLNLSNFNTSKVTHLNSMFEASKFLVLDLSGFNFENVVYDSVNKDFFFIFTNSYLKFLSIKDIKINETKVKGKESIDIIEQINSIKNKTSMYLCLNDAKIMSQIDKNITICCEFDKNTQTCDSSNYFSLYYTNNVLYASGFENDNRKEIAFLKYGNQMKRAFESISIESNKNLDVKFAYPIDSLNNFFYNDVNKNTLVSLDFSKFDSSKITSVENVFNGLTSLKYIDLSGFGSHFLKSMKGLFKDLKSLESINLSNMKISKVTSIESMFENCVLLTSIDLSHLDTTSLIKIDKLFCGCSALKVIDFSNLNLENVNSASNIFYGLPTNFEYINLTNAKLSDALFSEIKSEINDKYYYLDCYTTEIIQNGDYKCCNTNGERNCFQCSDNKIIFYDKISFLSSKEQISCGNIDITKFYLKEEGTKKYYRKCENAMTYCDECSSADHCTKIKTNYALKRENNYEYVLKTSIENDKHFYTNDSGITYYSCSLYNTILNCDECSSRNTCNKCQTNYALKRENNYECVLKTSIENDKHFYTNDSGITYYSCSLYNTILNCDECSSRNTCDKCQTNYAFKRGSNIECSLITSLINDKHFYTNDSGISYYSCNLNNAISNCNECSNGNTCDKCIEGYVLKRNNNYECVSKTSIENDKHFYSNDSEITYYSCSLYNDITNCDECSNKNTCDKCLGGYSLLNNNKLCAKQEDIENNLYAKNNYDLYILCSSLIKDCYSCTGLDSCSQCQDGAGLTEDDACVNEAEVEEKHDYYKDEITNKYISCSIMSHCLTCNSSSVCTSCEAGFNLDNNKCKEEKDSGLSKGAIAGISLGTLSFLSILLAMTYYVYKKKKDYYQQKNDVSESKYQKTERDKEKESDPITEKQNLGKDVIYKRRNISNSNH